MEQYLLATAQDGGLLGFFLPLILIFGIFWLLVIRPQSKQRREREQMLSRLKKGDKVVTNGGLLGTVSGIRDGVATLLVSDKVRIRVLVSQIAGPEDQFTGSGDDDSDDKKK